MDTLTDLLQRLSPVLLFSTSVSQSCTQSFLHRLYTTTLRAVFLVIRARLLLTQEPTHSHCRVEGISAGGNVVFLVNFKGLCVVKKVENY